ncbi:hypothetical protein [Streptomyces sp. NBC_01224]|uniref:hypothetical protein n=1 Tax=Streptomyces sp. NBC_01224 TaxID=2903783 RepID=UPI003FA3436E
MELTVFRNGKLWLVLCTSTLIIGATFAAFSYFTPVLTEVTGFSRGLVPLLLLAYGASGEGPKPGDRVVTWGWIGGWAQLRAVPVGELAVLPEQVSFTQAATLPVAAVTALRALRRAQVRPGHQVPSPARPAAWGDSPYRSATWRGPRCTPWSAAPPGARAWPSSARTTWSRPLTVDHETGDTVEHVGDFEFFRADPYETRDLFGVLDGHDGDVGLIAEAILDLSAGHFRNGLDDVAEPLNSSMPIRNSATVTGPWRGFGIGTAFAGRAIKHLGSGCRGAACYPAPLDSSDPDEDEDGRKKAKDALRRSWERLGFQRYRLDVYVLDLCTVTLDKSLAALVKCIEELPQPDLDEWIALRTEG